jgi:5-methylcytosine-specific restriction endonuclease McrBC regulatory subunit McrC
VAIEHDLALQQLRRGLFHAYRRLNLRLPVVRGRLRIAAQLARLPERLDAHLLTADEFTADIDLNRAIKGGISRIDRLSRVTETRARCRELLARLDTVADAPSTPQHLAALLRGLVLDRRHAHFTALIRVLTLIVTDQGSAAAAGAGAPGPPWLFAMDKLFEAYVAERLQQVARGVEIAIQAQSERSRSMAASSCALTWW